MNKIYRASIVVFLILALSFLASCAPYEFQGTFNASFSLTECLETKEKYQYEFYADGQGIEKNSQNGSIVTFTYSALNGSLTVNTENTSFVYPYKVDEEKDLNMTYQKNGKAESILLVKK